MMKIQVDDDSFSRCVANDLLWNAEHAEDAKMRKACLRVAFYYMTYDQVATYLGSTAAAEEYFQ